MKMINRRQLMWSGAVAALAAGAGLARAGSQPAAGGGEAAETPFAPEMVVDMARRLAQRPFARAGGDLPEELAGLTYEQYVGVRARPEALLWDGERRGFVIEPLPRGALFRDRVEIYVVADGQARRLTFNPASHDFGGLPPPPPGDAGFSGFRIFAGLDRPAQMAIFQGATFYRAIARGQNMGATARTLTLRPGEMRGEEIPAFRAFWIEQPPPGADVLTLHALLDSESLAAAAHFTVRPGDMTIIDVEVTLFTRAAIDHIGWGGHAATYLFGAAGRRNVDDVRAAVFEVNGLQMRNGRGEWLWRPVTNPQQLQISAFVDSSPRGFGLLQRERAFAAFQDDSQRFDRRPSVWVEPLGDWGEGQVQLIEIPTESDINDNILAYWRPRAPLAAGAEVNFAYRQYWCWQIPDPPELARVILTRTGRGRSGRRRRFLVEFTGAALADPGVVAALQPSLSAANGGVISEMRLWPYPERRAARVAFELDPGDSQLCELRLALEAAGKPVSETWLYRWTA